MQLPTISVFNMSPEDRRWYKKNRLYPQECNEYWSCGSLKGYLKLGSSLSAVAEMGRRTMNAHKVSYEEVGRELQRHIQFPHQFGSRFVYTKNEKCSGMQVCPLASKHARKGCYSYEACYFSSEEITITNVRLNLSITVQGIVPHIIEMHHLFPEYLSPEDVIKVLEMKPNPSFRLIKAIKWEDSLETESSEEDFSSSYEPPEEVIEDTYDCRCIIS